MIFLVQSMKLILDWEVRNSDLLLMISGLKK